MPRATKDQITSKNEVRLTLGPRRVTIIVGGIVFEAHKPPTTIATREKMLTIARQQIPGLLVTKSDEVGG